MSTSKVMFVPYLYFCLTKESRSDYDLKPQRQQPNRDFDDTFMHDVAFVMHMQAARMHIVGKEHGERTRTKRDELRARPHIWGLIDYQVALLIVGRLHRAILCLANKESLLPSNDKLKIDIATMRFAKGFAQGLGAVAFKDGLHAMPDVFDIAFADMHCLDTNRKCAIERAMQSLLQAQKRVVALQKPKCLACVIK